MLHAEGLRKQYGEVVALHGLDLMVKEGELFCLLGANGAGKTTTIQLFLGFIRPSAGAARIAGLNVVEHPLQTKALLAYIPENVMLYPNLTGLENLRFFTTLAGKGELQDTELLSMLSRVGLAAEAVNRRVGTYSKGMRQKVGIAMAMAKNAKALLLDEPTSGLDPKASNEFSALLRRLRDDGVAILMATHDIFRSKQDGDRVGIMKEGRLVAIHTTSELSHADLERVYLDHMHH
ncbi:MAG: ABC transporter ATP-binding protein [Polyangiaceae bacterium]|nr:ABC transporter ATP-binding protein [Polyangiaceae bacterium]